MNSEERHEIRYQHRVEARQAKRIAYSFIKKQLHIKYYGRYMDDFYLMYENREYLKYCMEEIKKKCKE